MQPHISHEWMNVLTYYNSLENQWKRELYLNTLQKNQRDYLLKIVTEYKQKQHEVIIPKSEPTIIGAKIDTIIDNQAIIKQEAIPKDVHKTTPINVNSSAQNSTITLPNLNTKDNKPRFNPIAFLKRIAANLFTFEDDLPLPFMLLKYSVVGITAFVTVAVITSPQSSTAWIKNLPGVKGVFSTKELSAAEKESAFNEWIEQYKQPDWDANKNSDPDGDGLTNIEEFLLKTKPNANSTRDVEQSDGQQLLSWVDPSNGDVINPFNPDQVQKYNTIVNRVDLHYRLQSLALDAFNLLQAEKKEAVPTSVDTTVPGILNIGAIDINNVPIVWGSESSHTVFLDAMNNGVVQYPQSAYPDTTGLMYISGHSGDTNTSSNEFSSIFKNLENIQPNEVISIEVTLENGDKETYSYIVERINVFDTDDLRQFVNRRSSEIALSTCTPSTMCNQRLVVTAVRV